MLAANPYQRLLYEALERRGVRLDASVSLRISSLWRNRRGRTILHMHWPESYYRSRFVSVAVVKLALFAVRLAAARLLGYPVVWTVHQVVPHERTSPRLDRAAARLLAASSALLLAHDPATAAAIEASFGKRARRRTSVVPHGSYAGVYPAGRAVADVRSELDVDEADCCFLCFGNLRRYKGVELLLDAFARSSESTWKLIVAGAALDGEVAAAVSAAAARDNRIRPLLGFVADDRVRELFDASDVVVLPRSDGGTSGALVLARSLERVVVAADRTAYAGLVGDDGELFAPGDASSLSDALARAASRRSSTPSAPLPSFDDVAERLAGLLGSLVDQDASGSIRRRVVQGIGWKTATAVVSQVSRLVVALTLARLLAPHDYGIAGMVIVLSGLVAIFADLALGAALVQRDDLTDADTSTVFWVSVVGGVAFTLVGVAVAGPVSSFFHEPAVRPLFAALALTFAITSVATVQSTLLVRELDFRSLEIRQMAGIVGGAVVGITVAVLGGGAWAIILQQLAVACISTVLLWRFSRWRPRLLFSLASLRKVGGYGANVLGTRLLFYANRNIDNLLVGRFIGAAALGAYSLAYNVMLYPFSQIASPIQEVLFPAFSRMQDDRRRIADVWIAANRLVGAISIPALVGLMLVAPEFVHVVLGPKWHAAVPVIRILSWVGLLQSLQRLNSSVLQALDRTRVLLRYSIVVLVASVCGFVGGLHWGIVGVSAGYAVTSSVLEPYYTVLTSRAMGISPLELVRALRGVVEATAIMAVAVELLHLLLVAGGVGPTARLLLEITAGVLAYPPAAVVRVGEIRRFLGAVRSRGLRPALEPTA